MEDLKRTAIIFIYSDGKVDEIPITTYKLHMDYLREHLNVSPRFEDLCGGLNFYTNLHGHIDTHLTLNGVVVIFNLDVSDIVEGFFDLDNKMPSLVVSLPESLSSLKQVEKLEEIYNRYPNKQLLAEIFIKDLDTYKSISSEEVLHYLNEAKENLGSTRK